MALLLETHTNSPQHASFCDGYSSTRSAWCPRNSLASSKWPSTKSCDEKVRTGLTQMVTSGHSAASTCCFGDMWQLKPVTGLALFASPSDARSQTAYLGCMLLWKSLRRCWELTGSQRCSDAWYNDVLRQCRHGHLTEEPYGFLHGSRPAPLRATVPRTLEAAAHASSASSQWTPLEISS